MLTFLLPSGNSLAAPSSTNLIVLGAVALVGGLGLIAAGVRYPSLGFGMILLSVVLSGYSVEVGRAGIQLEATAIDPEALTLRLEYLLVPLGTCSLVLGRMRRRERVTFGRSVWLAAWIGVNILSSAARSPALSYSLRMIYFYVVGALAYVGVVNYASDRSRLRSALLWTAGVVAAEAAFALFLGGRWLDTGVVRLYGSFGEPVLFAGFMVPMSVLLLGWGMGSSASAASPRWGAPVAFAGLLVSALAMSRAAWGMAILGVGFMVVVLWRWRQVRPMRLLAGVAAGGALAIAVMFFWVRFAPAWYSSFNYVFTDSEDQQGLAARLESESWLWRLDIAREVVRVVGEEPIIGHGTLTFGQTHDVLGRHSSAPADGWIPTASLLVLHDTGVVGLVLLGVFLLAIAFDAVGTIRSGGIEGRTVALGGLLGLVAWLGMEQLSTTMTLGIGWVFLGLVSAVASVYRASPPPEAEVAPVDRPMSNAQ